MLQPSDSARVFFRLLLRRMVVHHICFLHPVQTELGVCIEAYRVGAWTGRAWTATHSSPNIA